MGLQNILNAEAQKLASITVTNNELENALKDMVFKDVGVSINFQLSTEWGHSLILAVVPEWENTLLSAEDKKKLEAAGYSFDFPDEDLTYLVERLFKIENSTVYIDVIRMDMQHEREFDLTIQVDLDHYNLLLNEVNIEPGQV